MKTYLIFPFFGLVLFVVSASLSLENPGKTRGHLETLYNLRSKLDASSSSNPSVSAPAVRKESRGYSFHYSPSGVTHPVYTSAGFSSRAGKVDDDSAAASNKLKSSGKSWSKYSKLAYKTFPVAGSVNSFNVHQKEGDASVTEVTTNANPPTSQTSSSTTSTTQAPDANLTPGTIQSLSQGLNNVMTTVLTQRLMSLLDQDVPESIFNPLKHVVATGNRMIDFWDKRTNARDGKNPGIVELFGYGLNQLKKFRDGQAVKPSDPVANLTSASKTLIQGMITVRKLTNRVLGYDTTNEVVESRGGGYGHDSYGHGGGGQYMSYGTSHGFEPFSLLAALAFGAFLLQLLLTLLNTSARSLNVVDLNTPLALSDIHLPNFKTTADNFFGTPTVRNRRDAHGGYESNLFDSVVDKLDGMYSTYKQVSEKPTCARLHMCRLAVDEAFGDGNSLLSPIYMYGLGHWTKDKSSTEFVESIKSRVANGEDVNCDDIVKDCPHTETNPFI